MGKLRSLAPLRTVKAMHVVDLERHIRRTAFPSEIYVTARCLLSCGHSDYYFGKIAVVGHKVRCIKCVVGKSAIKRG